MRILKRATIMLVAVLAMAQVLVANAQLAAEAAGQVYAGRAEHHAWVR